MTLRLECLSKRVWRCPAAAADYKSLGWLVLDLRFRLSPPQYEASWKLRGKSARIRMTDVYQLGWQSANKQRDRPT